MGSADWYHARGGQHVGPVSREELTRRLTAGEVGPDDLVWREGLADWQPARAVPELAVAQPAVYPAPGPRPMAWEPGGFGASPQQPQDPGAPMLGYGGYTPSKPAASGLAVAAFVISLVALVGGVVFAITAFVMGIVALVNAKQTGRPKGLAIAAVVISGLKLLLISGILSYVLLRR